MRKNISLHVFLLITFCSVMFFGCASLQKDIIMTTDSFVQSEDVENLEKEYVFYDAKCILNGTFTLDSYEYLQVDELIKKIDLCIEDTGVNKIVVSRLYALKGLSYLLQGKKSKAKNFYESSYSTNKGDSYTYILGYRLGIVSSLEDENIISGSNQQVLLVLEQGISNFKTGEYAKCVAQLDSAFLSLPDYYREAYGEIRQNAWNLRNNADVTQDSSILTLLNKSQISISDMVIITQGTTELLNNITGGKSYSDSELFTILLNSHYFDAVSGEDKDAKGKKITVKKNQIVTREICARYLWNILCEKKGYSVEQKTRNSNMYRNYVGDSPIPDVDINSPDFDAILGVVENEIMYLPDGENFMGSDTVSAPDFSSWLQKI